MTSDRAQAPLSHASLGPAPHLSSRASWTDCSRLLGREEMGSEVSLFCCPQPLPRSLPLPHLPAQLLLSQERPLFFPL